MMTNSVDTALEAFSQRFVEQYQEHYHSLPFDDTLFDIASPCIVKKGENQMVYWQPKQCSYPNNLKNVETALDILIRPEITTFYTYQYANHMPARFDGIYLTLLQIWNDDDFTTLQENLICHLVMQRQLKLSPTLFIASTQNELEIISVKNITGDVILEQVGKKTEHRILAPTLYDFLQQLQPEIG